jgi:hypothetical protein
LCIQSCLNYKKSSRYEQVMHILVSSSQKHNKKIPWSLNTTWAILLMHEQMLNDPWAKVTTLFTNIECIIWTNKKGHKNVHLSFQWTWFLKICFLIDNNRGKRAKCYFFNSVLATTTSSFGYVYQNFACVSSLWSSCDHDVIGTTFELNHLELKHFKLAPF